MINAEKTYTILSQIEQWSILGNIVNYIQYDKHAKIFNNLNIRAVNWEKHKRKSNIGKERQMLELHFWRHTREIEGRILRYIQ